MTAYFKTRGFPLWIPLCKLDITCFLNHRCNSPSSRSFPNLGEKRRLVRARGHDLFSPLLLIMLAPHTLLRQGMMQVTRAFFFSNGEEVASRSPLVLFHHHFPHFTREWSWKRFAPRNLHTWGFFRARKSLPQSAFSLLLFRICDHHM